MTPDAELFKQRLKVMKELLRVLRPERYTYLGACIFFSIVLAAVMGKGLMSSEPDVYKTLIPMFGSSGGVVVMTGLSLVVFHRALNIVFAEKAHTPAPTDKTRGKKAVVEADTNDKAQSEQNEKGAAA